jgi:hypothetical protein
MRGVKVNRLVRTASHETTLKKIKGYR